MRRPRRVALSLALLAGHQLEQRFQRVGPAIDSLVRVTALLETQRHRLQREIARIAGLELIPLDRRGYGRLGCRSHRICAGDRPIASILVVVDENAVALLLPPLGRRELRRPALHFACQRERTAAHLVVSPKRLDANVDVNPALAGCLGIAGELEVLEHVVHEESYLAHLWPL